ncbi:putative acetate--CoA ligase [Nocardia nova SH22a]|uniref:Putative acetate--CoA ligase n=1 Tax=Nocardia nova SH22a TaxID=1415166 RepID=W5TS65_9NOCA|nr:putative acetate--CoA ligase [Nocardia nova SH22a]
MAVAHPKVAESAVMGAADVVTGQAVVAYVILRDSVFEEAGHNGVDDEALVTELSDHVRKEIGPIARPRQIMIVGGLPKTRSGKIVRRLLRDVAEGRDVGDTQTLADPSVMDSIIAIHVTDPT